MTLDLLKSPRAIILMLITALGLWLFSSGTTALFEQWFGTNPYLKIVLAVIIAVIVKIKLM